MSFSRFHRSTLLAGLAPLALGFSGTALADASADSAADSAVPAALQAIVVTGSKEKAQEVGGSATYLDLEDLGNHAYSDINRVLRQVPGVHLREEDGYGLRPNISIRGSYDDRNQKIGIYEDGVLKAPAPYAAPAAYYFPAIGRMAGVEVVKGAGAIKYGPHTAGGTVHLFSTPIPEEPGTITGRAKLSVGENDTLRGHAYAGGRAKLGDYEVGILLETYQNRSDGFKKLDNGGPTGFRVEDYVGKIGLRSGEGAGIRQSLEFKFEYYKQRSDETYLGLSRADFALTPNRRYAGSQRDQINVKHYSYQLTHHLELGAGFDLTTIGYVTKTSRVWYKLQDVRNAMGSNRNLGDVLSDPGSANNASAYSYLTGADSPAGALRVRSNDRLYRSKGIQSVLTKDFALAGASHALELSARYHQDKEDRFQQDDRYTMLNGTMILASAGVPGSQANQVDSARAWSFFVRDTIRMGDFTLTPGLRYETITLKRERYTAGPGDTSRSNRGALLDQSRDKVDVWIPGISATYRLAEGLSLLAGVHRGFTNPAPVSAGGTLSKPEKSTNWEAGLRYDAGTTNLSLVGFFNNYKNFVGTCTASSGGDCTIGDQFSGGRVHAKGVEFTARHDAGGLIGGDFTLPLSVVYTYTHATFRDDLASFGPWGEDVARGDKLPNLAPHMLTVNAGIGQDGWKLDISGNYTSATRGSVGAAALVDPYTRIAPRMIFDLAGEVKLKDNAKIFASVENLFDKTYNVGTLPAGWRPGLPRTIMAGLQVDF